MTDSNVQPIREGVLVPQREVDPDLISALEQMLAEARAGEIVGFCGAVMFYDGLAARRRAGKGNYNLLGAVTASCHVLAQETISR